MSEATATGSAPKRAGLVLISLILVAGVANLNLSVANVALPDIGKSFDASQTALDLIAVGYSLGLAACVLWFGALGDRSVLIGMALVFRFFPPKDEEEPLASEPTGVYQHSDGRPMLGRKLKGTSQRELRDLGLLVEDGDQTAPVSPGAGTT